MCLRFRVTGLGFRGFVIKGLGFKVWGSGPRALRFRVWDLGSWAPWRSPRRRGCCMGVGAPGRSKV